MPAPKGVFLGLSTVDAIYRLDGFPHEDSKNTAADFGIYAGGPATNAAATFAFLGGDATLYSAVGRSAMSTIILGDLDARNVAHCDLAPHRQAPPPMSSILVSGDKGYRTIVSAPSQDIQSPTNRLPAGWLDGADILLLDGFDDALAAMAAKEAQEKDCTVVLDGDAWKPSLMEILPWVDVVIFGQNFQPYGAAGFAEIAGFLWTQGVSTLAMTRGDAPILFQTPGQDGHIDIGPRQVVDTLGAGDIFHGAFCYYYMQTRDFEKALTLAADIAGESVERFGTRAWMMPDVRNDRIRA